MFFEITAAEDFEDVEDVFHRLIHDIHQEKYGHVLQPLFISEEKGSAFNPLHQRRPKSPKGGQEKKDEKNAAKKTPTTFNKFFKIFN